MTDSPSWLAPRNTKIGSRHAVASGHYLASAAARPHTFVHMVFAP